MTLVYCEFLRQGLPTIEATLEVEEKRLVANRSTTGLQIPTGVFAFYFYDETDGVRENISPMHYVGGEVLTRNGKRIIQFRGNTVTSTFTLRPEDILIPA